MSKRAATKGSFQPGHKPSPKAGRPKSSGLTRELMRRDEAAAWATIIELSRTGATDSVRLSASETIVSYARGRPPAAPWMPEPIEGVDLTTEQGILDALRKVTTRVLEGRTPLEHAKGIAVLLGAILHAERGAMESQVHAALQRLQDAIDYRGQPGLPAPDSSEVKT